MRSGLKGIVKKGIGEMGFNAGGGAINWFPGHMAAATRAIRDRLKLADLVIEVRDSRKWIRYFDSCKQDCIPISAHSKSSVQKLLEVVEFKLKEVISREPTLLVMVVGVPNVGKSALINSIHQIALSRFAVQGKKKRATVGPLPGVTQDIAGYKIAHKPSIYVLDTPGVLVPSIPDIETGLKLSLAGSVKDSVVGEERIARYLLAVLNTRGTPLHWKHWNNRKMDGIRYESEEKHKYDPKDLRPNMRKPPSVSDVVYVENLVTEVQCAMYKTLAEFNGNVEDENDLENLIEQQFEVLQKALKIPHKASEARLMVSKKFLTLFRTGKLGCFILDDVPETNTVS
ncbi:short integuments 2, mitochondrial isoform X2 [Populus trichocarpa]|uniref:short integuments 2, mitochondrial isoform X2 n=1 Tax=Populus trichocarpa TaxID=3694 RepID=UPI000CCD20CA|nr:short integuments 2, mitochondrial isoform X2 [Populus trichocarpa]|eukprot:XP_024459030.1 short integuments 2, mitochondrial isoform X2 [Populus trichocarpa]